MLLLVRDSVLRHQDYPARAALRAAPWLLFGLAADQVFALSFVVKFWGVKPDVGDRWQATGVGAGSALLAAGAFFALGAWLRRQATGDQRWEILAGLGGLCLLWGSVFTWWVAW